VSRALAQYGTILRQAARGRPVRVLLVDPYARRPPVPLAPADWCGGLRDGDDGLLDRCTGATLDVGCGPGRLTEALTVRGRTALGVDTSAEAVRQARRRGAPVRHGCVFSPVPDEGAWRHVLLADGNIGIGGDPVRLLSRCRALLAPGGDVLVELDAPGSLTWQGIAALHHDGRTGPPFRWAAVAADDVEALAHRAALSTVECWGEAGRCFARLVRPVSG
jgi:SAM-dependent methyltransferase